MSDAPRKIWIERRPEGGWVPRFRKMPDSEHEYIRDDLPPTLEQAMKLPEIAAMVEALRVCVHALNFYASSCDGDETENGCGYEGNLCCKTARTALAAIEKASVTADAFADYHSKHVGTELPSDCV